MDVGEYDTNTVLINNLSSIAFRIYEPVVSQSSTYTFNASDVENALRRDGHLVYMDDVRRGYWCFYLVGEDEPSLDRSDESLLGPTIEVCGYRLGLVQEGAFEPLNLLKSRSSGTNPVNTPNSSSSAGSGLDSNKAVQPPSGGATANLVGSTAPTLTSGTETETKMQLSNMADPKGYNSIPVNEMHKFFIQAILSSLSTSFCRETGSIPLTPKTMLLSSTIFRRGDLEPPGLAPPSALATFRVYLTTKGSLVISLNVSLVHGLISFSETLHPNLLSHGASVLAAPLGTFASFHGLFDKSLYMPDTHSVQSPDNQVTRLRQPASTDKLSRWKAYLAKLLQMHGISPTILEGCSWLNIQFFRGKANDQKSDGKRTPLGNPLSLTAWPSVLCFRKPTASLLTYPGWDNKLGNRDFDALGNAKSWHDEESQREQEFAKRRKERDAFSTQEAPDMENHNNQRQGASPLTLRRTSNAGAATAAQAGAMYPTPPDGVQMPGVTPSMDGNVPSPTEAPNLGNVADEADNSLRAASGPLLGDTFGDGWDVSGQRADHGASFLEGENLFDGLGDDMFENNELTDADFSFFDEQPAQVPDNADVADIDTTMDISPEAGQPAAEPSQTGDSGIGLPPSPAVAAAPPPPVFAKPELRHARSTLNLEATQQTNLESYSSNSLIGLKRQPSPFNPDTVYKRIRASLQRPNCSQNLPSASSHGRSSAFEKVNFDPYLSLTNKKYQERGQFFDSAMLPTKDSMPMRDEKTASVRATSVGHMIGHTADVGPNIGSMIAKITGALEGSCLGQRSVCDEDALSDADDGSLLSDGDDSSVVSDGPLSPFKSSVARRRQEDDSLSLAASVQELEQSVAGSPSTGAVELPRLSSPGTPELTITKYFADPEPYSLQLTYADEDFITIAQVLTEQAVGSMLRVGPRGLETELRDADRIFVQTLRHSMQSLLAALPHTLNSAAECRFRSLLQVQDVPLLGQPSRMQPSRPVGQEQIRPNIFQIPSPHVEVRRHESKLSVLPSALSFWESLGFGPRSGGKDINAICVFPDWKGMRDNAKFLLERLRSVYESLKLGTFENMPSTNDVVDGLLSYATDDVLASTAPANTGRVSSALSDCMSKLSLALSSLAVAEKNFVVFFVYAPDIPGSILQSCAAFQDLFEKYRKAVSEKKKAVSNELVLQLVPLEAVASETSLAILSPAEQSRLCFETYDRCTLFKGPMPAPAVALEQNVPRMIDFKPSATPSVSVLHENSCIHIAYAQSIDERWVTAAWTDNQGYRQMTASYCRGRRGRQLATPLTEVIREIWETTHDLTSIWKVHWRVIVTKCGPMDPSEMEYWTALAQTENKTSVSLTLLTVDTNPSLQLIPPAAKISSAAPATFYTTPVSTPQPSSILSPEQSGNPPTPAANSLMNAPTPGGDTSMTEPEADTTLVDITDTTWGAVASHRLNNSSSLADLRPARQSGYLVKRGGTRAEDPPVAMEVNIIHSDGSAHPRLYDLLLREMLTCFRGLGTLARVRGVVDGVRDVRPWHVAAAEKGVRTLYQLM
ncbi:hypothetical protein VTK73DRAFT_4839 [Phialemonium thermophilum]|uniref:Mediator of RNA polymerase II transcription subunit 13 n=1 Tax=Phialemonium thermophilum TaxID=223376 RepID=A0ABR3WS52_9PEZI